ncbi:MAG: CDP-diacylglycerol--glycerol-3-phosphate 3-phosphatidyltransferase [Candidatus Omnitrophica bacterium]|nr:CDP-diacylglycerol--glycerol-3-phosphate 3-phosphatidyltransferase [Candidatus Omnitrophota bacterium]
MTIPTKLTCLRMILTFLIVALLYLPGWLAKAFALGGFVLAGATDWLDGYLARRWNQVSPLGALLDPIADKVLVLGTFLAFVQLHLIPAWMVLIIALREFVITGVRLFAASRQIVLPAAKEGKHKTVSQMGAIIVILIVLVVQEFLGPASLSEWMRSAMQATVLGCMAAATLLTIISGTTFVWRHHAVLKDAVGR